VVSALDDGQFHFDAISRSSEANVWAKIRRLGLGEPDGPRFGLGTSPKNWLAFRIGLLMCTTIRHIVAQLSPKVRAAVPRTGSRPFFSSASNPRSSLSPSVPKHFFIGKNICSLTPSERQISPTGVPAPVWRRVSATRSSANLLRLHTRSSRLGPPELLGTAA
jgi:hypothetical protein